jgi:hypothetical protein
MMLNPFRKAVARLVLTILLPVALVVGLFVGCTEPRSEVDPVVAQLFEPIPPEAPAPRIIR